LDKIGDFGQTKNGILDNIFLMSLLIYDETMVKEATYSDNTTWGISWRSSYMIIQECGLGLDALVSRRSSASARSRLG